MATKDWGCLVIAILLSCWTNIRADFTPTVAGSTELLAFPSELRLELEAAREKWLLSLAPGDTGLGVEIAVIVRISGADMVPFRHSQQRVIVETMADTLVPALGAVELRTYVEGFPDPAAPPDVADVKGNPFIDMAVTIWGVPEKFGIPEQPKDERSPVSSNSSDITPVWDRGFDKELATFFSWIGSLQKNGLAVNTRMLSVAFGLGNVTSAIPRLGYMIPLQVLVAVRLADASDSPPLEMTNASSSLLSSSSPGRSGNTTSTSNDWANFNATELSRLEFLMTTHLRGWAAMNVEVVSLSSANVASRVADWGETVDGALSAFDKRSTVLVEFAVTAYACTATVRAIEQGVPEEDVSQGCEIRAIYAAMEEFWNSQSVANDIPSFGNGTVVALRRRPSPAPPTAAAAEDEKQKEEDVETEGSDASSSSKEPPTSSEEEKGGSRRWVPWHLDMLDQRQPPLDGQYTASADGTGVNVYLISSGIRADHQEFAYIDGRPGRRVVANWGFNGTDSLQDCPDGVTWYHFGTYAASIIAGKTVGVAPNATLHSVRMRQNCFLESPGLWGPGGVPSAIDAVLSTFKRPGVMVIDTWWSRSRFPSDNDEYVETAIMQRLQRATELDIPIIISVGSGLSIEPACNNVLAKGETAIRVASVGKDLRRTMYSATNATCIDIWAPGGSLGDGMMGADALAADAYRSIVPSVGGASWVVAGIAAQLLQLHPNMTTAELRRALLDRATRDVVIGAGIAPNLLAFTDLKREPFPSGSGQDSKTSASAGALAGAIVGGCLMVLLVVLIGLAVMRRRRRRCEVATSDQHRSGGSGSHHSIDHAASLATPLVSGSVLDSVEWEIVPSQIRILRQKDGSPWVLGRGQWGEVHRALKDGMQDVAVKTLKITQRRPSGSAAGGSTGKEKESAGTKHWSVVQDAFAREIAMMQWLSRDANVVQFFGAVVRGPQLMLVTELMEGGDLRAALTADMSKELKWDRRGKSIALDVVRGLHFLHSNGVVHRDVKSKNILLTRDRRAKIADVGVAQVMKAGAADVASGNASNSSGGSSSTFVGTLSWAAPEMLLGQCITARSDIYSLGVVLWEIATQEIPLRGRLNLPRVPEDCPQELVDVITACMAIDPETRPTAPEVYSKLLRCPPLEGFQEVPMLETAEEQHAIDVGHTDHVSTTHDGSSDATHGVSPATVSFASPLDNETVGVGGFAQSSTETMSSLLSSSSLLHSLGNLTPALQRTVLQIRKSMKSSRTASDGGRQRDPAGPLCGDDGKSLQRGKVETRLDGDVATLTTVSDRRALVLDV